MLFHRKIFFFYPYEELLKRQSLTANLMMTGDIQLFNALRFYHGCLYAVVLHEYWFACIFNDLSIGNFP
jgi:hypothetical protein